MVYETQCYPGMLNTTTMQKEKTNEIRVLAVRQPWASLIVEGLKTIEVRSTHTKIKGKIAIYASKYKYSKKQKEALQEHLHSLEQKNFIHYSDWLWIRKLLDEGDTGKILGTVEISSPYSCPLYSLDIFHSYFAGHLAPDNYFSKNKTHLWYINNPVRFETPLKYTPPRGAVVWSKTVLPEECK